MTRRSSSKRTAPNPIMRVWFDDAMYGIALVTPILTIPQLALIWLNHQTAGVSLLTWGSYAVMSGVWLIYGLLHQQKPLILSQACLFILDFGVVLGVFLFQR